MGMSDPLPPKRGRGRPRGTVSPPLTPEHKMAIAIKASERVELAVTKSCELANANVTPAVVPITDEIMWEIVSRLGAGEMLRSICMRLQVSSYLVRQRVYDQKDKWFDVFDMARTMNGHEAFEQMIEVARDPNRSPADKKVEIDVLRDIARNYNRRDYGDKVTVDHNKVVINVDMKSVRLT